MEKKNLKEWEKLSLKAIEIAFDSSGAVKKNISEQDKKNSIDLLNRAINEHNASAAWPYIKLADLIDDEKEKTKIYIKSFFIEENEYALRYLFKKIIRDYPKILYDYL